MVQVLHKARVKRQQETSPDDAAWIADMCQQGRLYVTPYGSNDDWYWMYAAVAAGSQGRLISNDEMRDHVFQLLAPRYFYKWKQRHQVVACFSPRLDTPPPPPPNPERKHGGVLTCAGGPSPTLLLGPMPKYLVSFT